MYQILTNAIDDSTNFPTRYSRAGEFSNAIVYYYLGVECTELNVHQIWAGRRPIIGAPNKYFRLFALFWNWIASRPNIGLLPL